MGTPSTQDATKSVRVSAELHARLSRLADGLGGTMGDAIEWLLAPGMVRVPCTPEQKERWAAAAKANGMPVSEFVTARVEGALQYGADPGALRRIHDMTLALVKAAGIIPNPSTPGADEQVIRVRRP